MRNNPARPHKSKRALQLDLHSVMCNREKSPHDNINKYSRKGLILLEKRKTGKRMTSDIQGKKTVEQMRMRNGKKWYKD